MKILITGACGFVGGHLVRLLGGRGHQIVAAIQNPACKFDESVSIVSFDITSSAETMNIVSNTQPDVIIHLAAQSMVVKSWEDPETTFCVNTLGTFHIVDAIRVKAPNCRMVNIGSSEEYGLTALQGIPLIEEAPCLPQNPYSLSKFSAGQLLLQMAKRHNLKCVHLRPFNHFGPGQRTGYAVSDFASQIARIESGKAEPEIVVGDLSASRDFTDVRDVVEAYALIAETQLPSGIYNICSGQARRVGDILEQLVQQSSVPIRVRVDHEKYRAAEVPFFVGSAKKLTQATGWTPKREFAQTLSDTLYWWRSVENPL